MAKDFEFWKADPFFAAAEEVQNSADRMESALRSWRHIRTSAETSSSSFATQNVIDNFRRDLFITLDTVKWQLQEFERAVKVVAATDQVFLGEGARSRHHDFFVAIQSRVTFVEHMLENESSPQMSQAIRLNIKHDDSDSFAKFLSGQRFSFERIDNYENSQCSSVGSGLLKELMSNNCSKEVESWSDKNIMDGETVSFGYGPEPAKINTGDDFLASQGQLEVIKDQGEMRNIVFHEKKKRFKESLGSIHAKNERIAENLDSFPVNCSSSGTIFGGRISETTKIDVVNDFVGLTASEKPMDFWNIQHFSSGMKNAAKVLFHRNGFKRWKDGDPGTLKSVDGGIRVVVSPLKEATTKLGMGWISRWPRIHRKLASENVLSESICADEKLCNEWKAVQCQSQSKWKAISVGHMVQIVSVVLLMLCLLGLNIM